LGGEIRIQTGVLHHAPHALPGFNQAGSGMTSEYLQISGTGEREASDYFNQRGLACSVLSDKAMDLAFLKVERDIVQDFFLVVLFIKIHGADYIGVKFHDVSFIMLMRF
jgi:hypothetical protein